MVKGFVYRPRAPTEMPHYAPRPETTKFVYPTLLPGATAWLQAPDGMAASSVRSMWRPASGTQMLFM